MKYTNTNTKAIANTQTPDTYNAENGESITWQEAVEKGYIDGGVDGEST